MPIDLITYERSGPIHWKWEIVSRRENLHIQRNNEITK